MLHIYVQIYLIYLYTLTREETKERNRWEERETEKKKQIGPEALEISC